jgi:type II secretory pathway pseudopilin PulG
LKKAITFIELIVVVAIVAVIGSLLLPHAFRAIEKAKVARAIANFKAIRAAADVFNADTGRWPHADGVGDSELLTDKYGTRGWDGPYLEQSIPMHPWGGVYNITTNANLGQGAWHELSLEFEDYCYPSGPNYECSAPATSDQKIDEYVDDGVRTTGAYQYENHDDIPQGYGDAYWALEWDFCEATISCGGPCMRCAW